MLITATTITDAQIRGLLDHFRASGLYECSRCGYRQSSSVQCGSCLWGDLYFTNRQDMRACYAALSTSEIVVSSWTKETARARCAEILNERSSSAKEAK